MCSLDCSYIQRFEDLFDSLADVSHHLKDQSIDEQKRRKLRNQVALIYQNFKSCLQDPYFAKNRPPTLANSWIRVCVKFQKDLLDASEKLQKIPRCRWMFSFDERKLQRHIRILKIFSEKNKEIDPSKKDDENPLPHRCFFFKGVFLSSKFSRGFWETSLGQDPQISYEMLQDHIEKELRALASLGRVELEEESESIGSQVSLLDQAASGWEELRKRSQSQLEAIVFFLDVLQKKEDIRSLKDIPKGVSVEELMRLQKLQGKETFSLEDIPQEYRSFFQALAVQKGEDNYVLRENYPYFFQLAQRLKYMQGIEDPAVIFRICVDEIDY